MRLANSKLHGAVGFDWEINGVVVIIGPNGFVTEIKLILLIGLPIMVVYGLVYALVRCSETGNAL